MELGHILSRLPAVTDPNLLVGAATRSDAAVYRIAADRALVATVDFFTPIVDDPRTFGAIAAANAVSDVYAMGGKPLFALSIVGFPRDMLDRGILEEIVAGGAEKLLEAGCIVAGGHSIDDAEPKFGYAVIGEVDPERVVSNRGARPGDLLYLTKPLGSGLVTTAIKNGQCPPDLERFATGVMTHLNRLAAAAMVDAGASTATDVTGYGLLGHLLNLEIEAEIEFAAVPLMPGVEDLARAGNFPSGSRRNHSAVSRLVDFGGLDEASQMLLCDAQTSGGLLVAVAPRQAPSFELAVASDAYGAVRVGRVTGAGPGRVRVV